MIGLVAVLKIKPGMEENVANSCIKMAREVRAKEAECLIYDPYVPADGAPEVVILEKYTSLEALEEHRKTPHYLELRKAIQDALSEPPQITILKSIE
ncbi:MAG TPA: putative quinol monooxygenase [Candidatus Limnocylindrales bacterium]|nr:putative quinol monooxygenase [Candidatus Limnocylindrales bacterium]